MTPLPPPEHPKCYKLALGTFLREGDEPNQAERKAKEHCSRPQSKGTYEGRVEEGEYDQWVGDPEGRAPGPRFKRGGTPRGGTKD